MFTYKAQNIARLEKTLYLKFRHIELNEHLIKSPNT